MGNFLRKRSASTLSSIMFITATLIAWLTPIEQFTRAYAVEETPANRFSELSPEEMVKLKTVTSNNRLSFDVKPTIMTIPEGEQRIIIVRWELRGCHQCPAAIFVDELSDNGFQALSLLPEKSTLSDTAFHFCDLCDRAFLTKFADNNGCVTVISLIGGKLFISQAC